MAPSFAAGAVPLIRKPSWANTMAGPVKRLINVILSVFICFVVCLFVCLLISECDVYRRTGDAVDLSGQIAKSPGLDGQIVEAISRTHHQRVFIVAELDHGYRCGKRSIQFPNFFIERVVPVYLATRSDVNGAGTRGKKLGAFTEQFLANKGAFMD